MKKENLLPINFYRFVLISLSIFSILSGLQVRQVMAKKGVLATSVIWNAVAILLFGIGLILTVFGVISMRRSEPLSFFVSLKKAFSSVGEGLSIIFIVLISMFYIFFFRLHPSFNAFFGGFIPHLLLLWVCTLLIFALLNELLRTEPKEQNYVQCLLIIPLCLIISQKIIGSFTSINNVPFSSSWAESSHLYFSSVIFSKKIYGISLPVYPYNLTRYIMQSIPFLFSNLPIWVHRAWQVFLNVSVVLVFILSLQKRLNIKNRLIQLIFLTFNYLWLSQIYIYYHLIIIALVIIAFYSNGNWKRNLPIIFFSSVWAGFSRINWIPVPGLLAAFLYFLETKYDSRKKILTYIHQPLLYSLIGIVTGLIAQIIYIFISGNNSIRTHTAIFRSSLLWYRLFPNSTFVLGILPGILIISGFIIFFVIRYFFLQGEVAWNRKLFIAIILITFFVGGLVVSVKIGGGNNLHNMDAFIVFLLVLACYVYFDNINVDNVINYQRKLKFPRFILIGIVVTPILWSLFFTSQPSVTKMNESGAEEVIRKMNRVIETYSPNRKILFISQRQLVTFNYLKNIEMVPDFEQELLMEMVMSHDKERLDKFYEQLINHTYEIIITYPLNTKLVGYESSFSEENNLWVNGVSRRIYNRYQTIALFPDYGIEMLIPK